MTPKEKAEELIYRFNRQSISNNMFNHISYTEQEKKDYANKKNVLLCINQIIKVACGESDYDKSVTKLYWQEVKNEIEKL